MTDINTIIGYLANERNFSKVSDYLVSQFDVPTSKLYQTLTENHIADFKSIKQLFMFIAQVQPTLWDQIWTGARTYIEKAIDENTNLHDFTLYSHLTFLCYLTDPLREDSSDINVDISNAYRNFKAFCHRHERAHPRFGARMIKLVGEENTRHQVGSQIKKLIEQDQRKIKENTTTWHVVQLKDCWIARFERSYDFRRDPDRDSTDYQCSVEPARYYILPKLGLTKLPRLNADHSAVLNKNDDGILMSLLVDLLGSEETVRKFMKTLREQIFFPYKGVFRLKYSIINLIGPENSVRCLSDILREQMGKQVSNLTCGKNRNEPENILVSFVEDKSPFTDLPDHIDKHVEWKWSTGENVPIFVCFNLPADLQLNKSEKQITGIFNCEVTGSQADVESINHFKCVDLAQEFASLLFADESLVNTF